MDCALGQGGSLLRGAQAASEAYLRTGTAVPADTVLARLQAKLGAKRKQLQR